MAARSRRVPSLVRAVLLAALGLATAPPALAGDPDAGPTWPASLQAATAHGEAAFERARVGAWAAARDEAAAVADALRRARQEAPGRSNAFDQLDAVATRLEHALGWRDREDALRAAQEVSREALRLALSFAPSRAVDAAFVALFERDVELALRAGDAQAAAASTRLLRRAWAALPEDGGGAHLRRAEAALDRLERAERLDERARALRAFVRAVDADRAG